MTHHLAAALQCRACGFTWSISEHQLDPHQIIRRLIAERCPVCNGPDFPAVTAMRCTSLLEREGQPA